MTINFFKSIFAIMYNLFLSYYKYSNMENNQKACSQSSQKYRRTMRVRTQQRDHEDRLSWKPTKSNNKKVYINDVKTKYTRCIFADKLNMMRNGNISQLNKYINLKTTSPEKSIRKILDTKPQKLDYKGTRIIQRHGIKKINSLVEQEHKMKRQQPLQLYMEIRQVFRHLQVLKNYGFSQKKITKWMNSFLSKKGHILRDIFLKSYLNKKSLNDSIIFERWTSVENIISKMQQAISKLNKSQLLFLTTQIKCFKGYIQDIVIRKTQSNLDQIFNVGTVNPILKFNRPNQYPACTQVMQFVKDLKTIQDRYGQLGSVSKLNRVMFKQILEAEQKFIDQFYSSKNDQQ